jgi:hypothetical protein
VTKRTRWTSTSAAGLRSVSCSSSDLSRPRGCRELQARCKCHRLQQYWRSHSMTHALVHLDSIPSLLRRRFQFACGWRGCRAPPGIVTPATGRSPAFDSRQPGCTSDLPLCSMWMTGLVFTVVGHRVDRQLSSCGATCTVGPAMDPSCCAAATSSCSTARTSSFVSSLACVSSLQQGKMSDQSTCSRTQHPACTMVAAVRLTVSMQLSRKRLQHGNIHVKSAQVRTQHLFARGSGHLCWQLTLSSVEATRWAEEQLLSHAIAPSQTRTHRSIRYQACKRGVRDTGPKVSPLRI